MDENSPAKPNIRNLIGTLVFLFVLALYAFLIAAIGDWLEAKGVHTLLQMVFYAIFGIIWFWPARGLFRWMAAGNKTSE